MPKELVSNTRPPKDGSRREAFRHVLKVGREAIEITLDQSGRTPEEVRLMSEAARNPVIEAQVVRRQAQKIKEKEKPSE